MARGGPLTDVAVTDVAGAVPLSGGYSGETFLVELASGERAVLRIYGRDPTRAPIDAALLRLVRGLVPVPVVLDLRRAGPDPAHLLTSYVSGTRLELVLPAVEPGLRSRLAVAVTDVLVALSGMPFVRPGMFVDADLRLSEQLAPADGLVEWLDLHQEGTPLAGWDPGLRRSLSQVCLHTDALLETVDRTCLVHSDFNAKNILVDPGTAAVTAVVDWEFAHAGSPYSDLGNLLRFERGTAWAEEVHDLFVARAPGAGPGALTLAYASDLWALIELAARETRHAVVVGADELLRAIARSGDLHASGGPG